MQELYERVPKPAVFAFVVLLAVLVPLVTAQTDNDIYFLRVGTVALVFALLALGLNVAVGFAGLLDLGYIAYYGIGAYGYAFLSSDKFGIHWQAWLVIPLVVAVSALGLLLALPSRRLVGDYLAIVTLFFGQIFYIIATQGYRISFLGLNKDLGPTGPTGTSQAAERDRQRRPARRLRPRGLERARVLLHHAHRGGRRLRRF